MVKALTKRQEEVLSFLREYINETGYPPSLRDICARFGIKGPKNAAKHLQALEKKGAIKRATSASRAIELLGQPRNGVSIPIAGKVRAGAPHLAVEDILGHVVLDSGFFKCAQAFLLRVEGDSMIDAGISEGDLVLVRPQPDAADGDIVVALLDHEATVKRFFRNGDEIVLKPENLSMNPIRVGAGVEFSIIGKVISVIRRLEK